MVIVNEKKELRNAIRDKENKILVKGKLARRVRSLEKFKKNKDCSQLCCDMGKARAVATMSSLGIPVIVSVTLIITVGVVSIVAILKDYSIVVKKGEGMSFEVTLNRQLY